MRRYNITPDLEPGNDTWAAEARIKIDEADNGEWVRYEDATSTAQFKLGVEALEDMKTYFRALIEKYADQVGACEGVTFLEDRYRNQYKGWPEFTDEEWKLLRSIAGVTE